MEIPLRFRQVALLPIALVFLLVSFPVAVVVHDFLSEVLLSFNVEQAVFIFTFLATIGGLAFWVVEVWLIYKFVSTGGMGFLD